MLLRVNRFHFKTLSTFGVTTCYKNLTLKPGLIHHILHMEMLVPGL